MQIMSETHFECQNKKPEGRLFPTVRTFECHLIRPIVDLPPNNLTKLIPGRHRGFTAKENRTMIIKQHYFPSFKMSQRMSVLKLDEAVDCI
jgi:hypothetical protein